MKTIIATRQCEGGWKVGIFHRATDAIDGGVAAGWLMKSGLFSMPKSEEYAARNTKVFADADKAAFAAECAFSVLKLCAEE